MRDTDFYQQILGLSAPWSVERVVLDLASSRVDVFVTHARGLRWRYPQCDRELTCRDHTPERSWRHLDACQLHTYVHGRVPRVECPDHGVVQVEVSWAEGSIAVHALVRAVRDRRHPRDGDGPWSRPEGTRLRHAGLRPRRVDSGSRVGWAGHGEPRVLLPESREQLEGIVGVSMDMWEHYVQATLAQVPDARSKIIFDRFHIMKQMTHAVDLVRRAEARELRTLGDDRLARTRYLWLYSGGEPAREAP